MASLAGRSAIFEKAVNTLFDKIMKAGGHSADEALELAEDAARKQLPELTDEVKDQAWKQARDARDELHDQVVREARDGATSMRQAREALDGKQVITGVTDPETGLSAAGHNFPADGQWGCAEKNALDNLNKLRSDAGYSPADSRDVLFSDARKVKLDGSLEQKEICNNWCQSMTDEAQFPPGTDHRRPGQWDAGQWTHTSES